MDGGAYKINLDNWLKQRQQVGIFSPLLFRLNLRNSHWSMVNLLPLTQKNVLPLTQILGDHLDPYVCCDFGNAFFLQVLSQAMNICCWLGRRCEDHEDRVALKKLVLSQTDNRLADRSPCLLPLLM